MRAARSQNARRHSIANTSHRISGARLALVPARRVEEKKKQPRPKKKRRRKKQPLVYYFIEFPSHLSLYGTISSSWSWLKRDYHENTQRSSLSLTRVSPAPRDFASNHSYAVPTGLALCVNATGCWFERAFKLNDNNFQISSHTIEQHSVNFNCFEANVSVLNIPQHTRSPNPSVSPNNGVCGQRLTMQA